jgi:hypothetical protein
MNYSDVSVIKINLLEEEILGENQNNAGLGHLPIDCFS